MITKRRIFEILLSGYDVVLNSQDTKELEKSLRILKPGGIAVSVSGTPDAAFAQEFGHPWYVRLLTRLLSSGLRRQAKRLDMRFSFLLTKANGRQLGHLTQLPEAGTIQPFLDQAFPFAQPNEGLAYVESSRAKGKAVVQVK